MKDQLSQLRLLVHESIEGIITEEGVAQLNALLRSDPCIRKYYLNYVNMQVILKNLYANEINLQLDNPKEVVDYLNVALHQLADDEKHAEPAIIEAPRPVVRPLPIPIQKVTRPPRKVNRASLAAAVASFAALVLWAVFAHFAPLEVAVLEDSIQAQWSNASLSLEKNSRYLTRQGPMALEKGTVKFLFNNDARIIAEAPAKFEIISVNEIKLYEGRLFARIPPEASGFTISSYTSRVIDIGTSFGVQVDINGATSVHVMKGSVNLAAGTGKVESSQVVQEQNAMRVSYDGATVRSIPYNATGFIREISSEKGFVWKGEPLDLVDIAKGGRGDGSQSPFCMINPVTGHVEHNRNARLEYLVSDSSRYLPVPALPAIDGVFVPNKTDSPVQISSMGHLFEECPTTSGRWFMPVLTESIEQAEFESEDGLIRRGARPSILENHLFGTPSGRAALTLHANIGITFDLDVIRDYVPGTQITGLSALWGISEASGRKDADSDMWILVDGQLRAHYNVQDNRRQAKRIVVKLGPTDRFLTLTTTDGGDDIDNDWLIVAEPVLLIE